MEQLKRIVYLTFYFQPDLCAGSFRNSPLVLELAKQAKDSNAIVEVYTTMPNRYNSYKKEAPEYEEFENLRIHRIIIPSHKSGMLDQIFSFWFYFRKVIKLNRNKKTDLVFASSSRLFTAYLGYKVAQKSKVTLYLDIRDIFVDTINDVLNSKILKIFLVPILKIIERQTFRYATHINLISGGFKDYFQLFSDKKYSFFTNGIDAEFLEKSISKNENTIPSGKRRIVYAGNIGEGQGLHKIIPQTAKMLEDHYEFLVYGDGGAKQDLLLEIQKMKINNVEIKNPIDRIELIKVYDNCDFLFLHLNDYNAFKKVLPSKIFELATFNKPILAGVSGFSSKFIREEVSDSFVFHPCDNLVLYNYLKNYQYKNTEQRTDFINKFNRAYINIEMAKSVLTYLK
jgi:hypothetical protein